MRSAEARCLLLLAMAAVACGSTGKATPVEPAASPQPHPSAPGPASYGPEHVGIRLPGPEVCGLSVGGDAAVAEGSYHALLRNARCEQQKFATMAQLGLTLGVSCGHCHAPHPTDPSKESYLLDTPNKAKAIWMYQTFVQGLRPVDGSPTMCASCHLDPETGEPVDKILGDPRDPVRAMEWMHEMTARFVSHRGERLRCSTCHQGMAPGTDDWVPNMVGDEALLRTLAPLSVQPAEERKATDADAEGSDMAPPADDANDPQAEQPNAPSAADGGT